MTRPNIAPNSCHTTTATTWGSIRVTHRSDGTQLLMAVCKICSGTFTKVVPATENPLAFDYRAAPRFHVATCRFHPNYVAPPSTVDAPRPHRSAPVPLPVSVSPSVSRIELLLGTLIMMAAIALGAWIW